MRCAQCKLSPLNTIHHNKKQYGYHEFKMPAIPKTEPEFCPKRDDRTHCNCWYDGEGCCACGAV